MHIEFAPIAILAALSLLLPLPWHWRARNIATLSIIVWLFVTNIIYAVGAVVWGDNADIDIPVWCDITTKIIIGTNFALPAACLCICMHLEQVASVRVAYATARDRKRRQIFEALMCFGLPAVFMALHYIVQGHRFDIIEEYGCRPTTYISIPGILIVYVPPLIMAVATLVFAALALRHFLKRRVTFAMHLAASNSALNTSRYLRLMMMALAEMFTSIALTVYTLWVTLIGVPIRSWTTWDDVHSDWLRIDSYYTIAAPPILVKSYYGLWWVIPASTFMFVAFFAFGKEAVDEYKKCLLWVASTIFRIAPRKRSLPKGVFAKLSFGSSNKDAIPISMKKPVTDTTTTTSSSRIPSYKLPSPPSYTRRSRDDISSYYQTDTDSVSETYHVDLEAHPLPTTPTSYAPTTPSTYGLPRTPFTPDFHQIDLNIPLPAPVAARTTTTAHAPHSDSNENTQTRQVPGRNPFRPLSYPSYGASQRKVLVGGM
nr:pheromone receptor B3 [Pleurotus eryngii]